MMNNRSIILNEHYEIDMSHALGKGATGTVYLGNQLKNRSPVAIKVIDTRTLVNHVTQSLLQNQIRALKAINNKHLLSCYQIFERDQLYFIITECCNGGTLSEVIEKQGALNENRALKITLGILDGYLHLIQKKIIHRDIKTSNIMLHNGLPKIIDFGYCEFDGFDKPNRDYNVGSPCYMAPQSFISNTYNEKTEVWAIGAILYQILTKKTLHDGTIPMVQSYDKIKFFGITFNKKISQFCKKIIYSCLNFDPAGRPTIFQLYQQIDKHLVGLSKKSISRRVVQNKGQINVNRAKHSTSILEILQKGQTLLNQNKSSQNHNYYNVQQIPGSIQKIKSNNFSQYQKSNNPILYTQGIINIGSPKFSKKNVQISQKPVSTIMFKSPPKLDYKFSNDNHLSTQKNNSKPIRSMNQFMNGSHQHGFYYKIPR